MLSEEDIIREAQRLEHLKDLLTALRKRGYDNVICADGVHTWLSDNSDDGRFRVVDEGTKHACVVRTIDYTCYTCGVKRHRVERYHLDDASDHDSDPFAELNRAQHRSEEE